MLSCQRRRGRSWEHCSGEKFGGQRIHTHCNWGITTSCCSITSLVSTTNLHLIGMCIYMNKPLHKSQIVNISVHFFPLFGWGKDTIFPACLERIIAVSRQIGSVTPLCLESCSLVLAGAKVSCTCCRDLLSLASISWAHNKMIFWDTCFQNIYWETTLSSQIIVESRTSVCAPRLQQ